MSNKISVYDLTIPSGKVSLDDIFKDFIKYCKNYVFQLEKGKTGYEHYQCRIRLKVRDRISKVIKMFPFAHVSVTSTECKDDDFYVMKDDTRIKGPWSDKKQRVPRQIRDIVLRPWQQKIVDMIEKWDTRTINIVIDEKGNIGKTILATYVGYHGLGYVLPPRS